MGFAKLQESAPSKKPQRRPINNIAPPPGGGPGGGRGSCQCAGCFSGVFLPQGQKKKKPRGFVGDQVGPPTGACGPRDKGPRFPNINRAPPPGGFGGFCRLKSGTTM